ncbi:hypothetical protein GOP47_0013571 [Adiantum capillus-veneris]|uniref:Uncharacterized protein n=1 Tax=Adiantum capillus-veneris TaxID=13818 RepID=A0A9D4ZFF9_ADICA|nr:hypothetical protein GOP47_0013571 [Adiantum capillus-veneris]
MILVSKAGTGYEEQEGDDSNIDVMCHGHCGYVYAARGLRTEDGEEYYECVCALAMRQNWQT